MYSSFVRISHSLPRTLPVKYFNVQLNRNYHFKGTLRLFNCTRKCGIVNHLNTRFSSTFDPTKGFISSEITEPLNQAIGRFCESGVVLTLTQKMIDFHDLIGLPWWAVIVLSTIGLRTFVILPFTIHQYYVNARYELLLKEMNTNVDPEIIKSTNKLAVENNWNQDKLTYEYRKEYSRRKDELIQKYNCHPMKNVVLILIQAPIWTAMSAVLRNLTYMLPVQDATAQFVYMEMKLNSFLWLTDLTVPDSSFGLSILYALFSWMSFRINLSSQRTPNTVIRRLIIYFFGLVTMFVSTVAMTLPSSIVLYWVTSTGYAVIQNLILLSPRVRRFLRIPTPDSMRKRPYLSLINKIKNTYKFLKY